MAGEYIDPDDGAPDCRMCGDTGSINGHPCDHRDRHESATAAVVGRFVPKNWDYGITTLYVAGPMTGLPGNNYGAFNYAAGELRTAGFRVENPADNTVTSEDYHDYLRAGLAQLLRCDGVATLEDWWLSGGARWEVMTAGILGLPIRSVDEWLS